VPKLLYSLSLSLSLLSCEKEQNADDSLLNAKSSKFQQENCKFEPYGLYFDNGVKPDCVNNMMHFSSWESFESTVDMLEQQVDDHEDSFVIPNNALSEDDLNDLEESTGFESDKPLIEFENSFEFCSLRRVERDGEDTWLANSNQPGWSWDDYIEDGIISDPYEQTLYNPQHEVMICGMIYKEMEDGLLIIDPNHPDATKALTMANEGASGKDVAEQYGGTIKDPGVVSFIIDDFSNPCITKSDRVERFILSNANYRIKGWHVMKTRNQYTYGKLKAFTKNYILKRGKYKKRRILSSARIYGRVSDPNLSACELINEPIDKVGTYYKKMRSKVKQKFNQALGSGEQLSTAPMELFSEHNQRGEIFTMDFRQR
jgi:hypothetical protein